MKGDLLVPDRRSQASRLLPAAAEAEVEITLVYQEGLAAAAAVMAVVIRRVAPAPEGKGMQAARLALEVPILAGEAVGLAAWAARERHRKQGAVALAYRTPSRDRPCITAAEAVAAVNRHHFIATLGTVDQVGEPMVGQWGR
ncbi:hypothetical protein WCLP8_210003 [uncultured Gammaproteobacteria bacterium]